MVKDPANGKILKELSNDIAILVIKDVDNASAICALTQGDVKVGDR